MHVLMVMRVSTVLAHGPQPCVFLCGLPDPLLPADGTESQRSAQQAQGHKPLATQTHEPMHINLYIHMYKAANGHTRKSKSKCTWRACI